MAKEPKHPAPKNHDQSTSEGEQPPKDPIHYAFATNVFIYSSKEHDTYLGDQQNGKIKEIAEWLKKLFYDLKITDILLTIFTGFLAVYTYCLWKSTEKLWRSGEKQIGFAEKAAEAATDQVHISTDALITTERAFVYCERIHSFWTADKNTELVVKWTFQPIWTPPITVFLARFEG